MALLNRKAFERKLQNMSSAQDSVQTVSLWMIHHKKHAEDMVIVWLDQLKKASKADRRLVLFYLANDVLQNSRKKGKEFSNAFTKILREAMQLLSEKTIKGNVERVIKIWEERKLFEKDYLEALRSKLASGDVTAVISKKPKEKPVEKEKEKEKEKEVKPAKQKRLPPADFKPSKLIDALKALRNFEGELTLKESQLNSLRIDASDLESVRQLKDRTGGGKFCEEYELATATLEEFLETLRREQEERKNIIKVLEDGEAFCDVSYGEVKVIVHAYKTFGNRLTSLKKKVDGKVNRLAQKEAEKAKTGPVSAPQASFLTSGLPDVAEGSAPSTPTQGQQASSDEAKAVDPTVDNIEVADMDIEDDSDSERSETSEEASAEDPKSSNDQTPNSTGSSDSQPTQSTTQELDITPVISPVPTVAPARPLTPNLGTMVPIQGSIMPNQPQIVPPRPQVPMVTHPFMGVQSVRFPAHAPQFRPGVPPIQPLPGMAQNQLLQPSGTLPVPGQITGQGQPFSQIPRPAGLLPSSNAPLAGGMGSVQPFPLGTGFVHSQAPLPVAAATVPVPVQVITNSAAATDSMKDNASRPQGVFDVGSPDSEASAPSPVGSPELHLAEGDETPETTPAPLGDVNVNDNTGFQTNKSFFENPVKNPTTSLGPGFSGTQSVSKTLPESPSSSSSTPSIPDQTGGQDSALVKKDNGQKVSAVDILAQLLSRGRKMQQPNETDTKSVPITTPVPSSIAAPVAPQQNSDKPQSKPLLSLIDSLFPKLSDSIKTLKEKEKVVNSSQFNTPVSATSLPAQPLPSESHFPHPSNVGNEQPEFPQSGLKSILKRGPKSDDEVLTPGQTSQVFRSNDGAFERPSMDHAAVPNVPHQGPVGVDPTLIFPEERPLGKSVENERNDPGPEPRHHQQQGNRINVIDSSPAATSPTHLSRQGPPLRGGSPRFPQERPFDRPLDMSPRGMSPFGPRLPFQDAHGPHFQRSRDNVGPPVERHEGPPDMPGRVPPEQPLRGHSPRGAFRDGPLRGPSDTSNVHQEHYMEKTAPANLPDVPSEDVHAGKPRNVEEAFVNGPPGMKRPPVEGAPIHRPDPRRSPHEQVPRADGPPPHRASYPGVMDDSQRRREFERWEEHRREPFFDHRRGPWDFPQDHPGPPPPDWRGPPLSPRGDPKRADFREDDPSMWTSFESPGRSPRTYERFREGPPEFDRFHGYGPPDRRRHSVGDFESERKHFPLKRPGPPPVPFPGPAKRPYY